MAMNESHYSPNHLFFIGYNIIGCISFVMRQYVQREFIMHSVPVSNQWRRSVGAVGAF